MTTKKLILSALCIVISFSNLFSQNLFKDDFSYPVLDSLEGTGGWNRSGVNLPYNVQVKSPGLTYTGYAGSGIGNTAYLSNTAEGDIVMHNFTQQSSGNLYLSFMIRVDSMTATATIGYNIGFNMSTGQTFINTMLYVKRLSATTFNLGIRKSRIVSYSSTVYNTNTTYLAVLKYCFVNGDNNDSAKAYIFSSGVPALEPALPTVFTTDSTDVPSIGNVILSNSYAQSGSLKGSSVKIDGIRVGLSWAGSVLSSINQISNIIPDGFSVSRNFPNPFNPSTKISFRIPEEGNVKLEIFDISGRSVSLLTDERYSAGEYSVNFNGAALSSGTYFYKLQFNSRSNTDVRVLKMTLVK
ncbi:MAG TPA: T9SS type A sorting domain-containing protein [Ignavibacteria bacterium]|nr:T9SS type A sorting domain-containing protein [Ignavibacteria bacterium]